MKKATKKDSLEEAPVFLKVVYFDDTTAQDYLDITFGGRADWSQENRENTGTEKSGDLGTHAGIEKRLLKLFDIGVDGEASIKVGDETEKIIATSVKNMLLTDYIRTAYSDSNVKKFGPDAVYAPDGSATMYKMVSSYLSIVPKEELPIDVDQLNHAVLDERGYYLMLLKNENPAVSVLRFNIHAFRNRYNLADLTKMKLTFWGIEVGECRQDELSIDKEFLVKPEPKEVHAENIIDGTELEQDQSLLKVYDVVLAGVIAHEKGNHILGA